MNHDCFQHALRRDGFEVDRRVLPPGTVVGEHAHPFDVRALARRAAEQLGFELRETSVGGASDGNFAAAMGLPVLDGLGAVGGGAHARHEHVTVSGMVERSAVAAAVIAAFRS